MLKPIDNVPIWKIISKFIGKDLTRISLPVTLNEPMTGLQRVAESLLSVENLFEKAANFEDPVKRICWVGVALCAAFNSIKIRKKKPFNPMLGETYELVTDSVKFVAEKIQHTPAQITATCMEGKNYRCYSNSDPK